VSSRRNGSWVVTDQQLVHRLALPVFAGQPYLRLSTGSRLSFVACSGVRSVSLRSNLTAKSADATLAEHEMAERSRRRIERHLAEARLPIGKTFDNFDFEAVPVVSKAPVVALASGRVVVYDEAGAAALDYYTKKDTFRFVRGGWRRRRWSRLCRRRRSSSWTHQHQAPRPAIFDSLYLRGTRASNRL
jgi:IstB-like ATP binding protein